VWVFALCRSGRSHFFTRPPFSPLKSLDVTAFSTSSLRPHFSSSNCFCSKRRRGNSRNRFPLWSPFSASLTGMTHSLFRTLFFYLSQLLVFDRFPHFIRRSKSRLFLVFQLRFPHSPFDCAIPFLFRRSPFSFLLASDGIRQPQLPSLGFACVDG